MTNLEDKSQVPAKIELLLKMAQQQRGCFTLLQQAESAKGRGDLDSAVERYDRLIAVSKRLLETALLHNRYHADPVDIIPIVGPLLNAMFTQADLWQSKGDLHRAETLRSEALAISKKHLGSSAIAEVERSQAASLTSQGRFNDALVKLAACRDFFLRKGDPLRLARTTLDMVDILQWLGDHTRALSELNHVSAMIAPLVSDHQLTLHDVIASLLESITGIVSGREDGKQAQEAFELYRILIEIEYYKGLINKALGKFGDAETCFKEVFPHYQKMGAGPAIEYQFACVLVGKGRYQEGLNNAEGLEPSFIRDGLLRPKLAGVLKIQAEALLNLGRPNEALEKLRYGIADLEAYYDPDLLWKLQWLRGRVLESMGQREDALGAYAESTETVKNLRKASLGYRLDSTYLKDKLELYESAVNLACRSHLAKECCEFMEMIKARALGITLSIADRHKLAHDESLKENFDGLTQQLDALEYKGYQHGQTEELRQTRASLLAERTALLERIRFSDPRWRTMTEPIAFDIGKVGAVLADREQAALSLFYRPDKVVAVLLKERKSTVASVEVSEKVNSRLKCYQRNLQSESPDPNLYDISAGLAVGAKHLVPPELLRQALQGKELIVVPHGLLHLVPWASLIFNNKRLFEYCPVGVLPNLGCIFNLGADFSTQQKVALIGSPDYGELSFVNRLPNAEKEIEMIRQMYSERGRIIGNVLTGANAREEGFWELANHKDAEGGILHIACHGTIEPNEPMNSGLLLTDSKVDAAEIALSSLKYDEVILSACSSGWRPMQVQGIELSGDDALGLPGAFLEAGVKSVLVSIPSADDATACRFMILYHQDRLDGKTPLAAFQETQKTMLSDSWHQPFTCAGFTAYGCR